MNTLSDKIMQDSALSYDQRMALLNYVQSLPNSITSNINQLTSAAVGAGFGALIAKLLLNMGLKSTILTAILGGLIGYNSATSNINNFDPLKNSGLKDIYGRYF